MTGHACPRRTGDLPDALDPLYANRYEVGAFASEAARWDIRYLGVCCGPRRC
jgi:betaine-homocysteine S-methyltransferase